MKTVYLFFAKSLLFFFIGVMFVSCGEVSLEIPYYQFAQVSKYEKDSLRTHMRYNNEGLSGYDVYIHDSHVSSSSVRYSSGKIYCEINGISYDIKLSNTRGGIRAESVSATNSSGARLYDVEYWYDDLGRLEKARVDGVASIPGYMHYEYEGNTIIIDDFGVEYRLELSSNENKGYVCNVLDYADAHFTSNYVINPNLYFLNIYGTPIDKLPHGHQVMHSDDNSRLVSVGKYSYEY